MTNISKNVKIAAELDSLMATTQPIVKRALERGYKILSEAPDPQAVLDLFGDKAVTLFSQYEAYRLLLVSFGEEVKDASGSFAPNSDGTVTYTPLEEG
ncbi:hypothetical protein OAI07_01340 [Akkermansiaceae bacterium]|nr:hypothetical protein [Akkermansiaceae bacterium]